MGYFSNGTEGDYYEAEYCATCQHQKPDDGGCMVWLAHLMHNYECLGKGDAGEQILDLLIPRAKDGLSNDKCRMHLPVVGAVSALQGKLFP